MIEAIMNRQTPEQDQAKRPPASPLRDAIDKPLVVLGLLFFVMAILGLPLLWMSRGFSTRAKIIWSLVVTLYTALLFAVTALILVWCWSQIQPYVS